jgi:hypothetical protein
LHAFSCIQEHVIIQFFYLQTIILLSFHSKKGKTYWKHVLK